MNQQSQSGAYPGQSPGQASYPHIPQQIQPPAYQVGHNPSSAQGYPTPLTPNSRSFQQGPGQIPNSYQNISSGQQTPGGSMAPPAVRAGQQPNGSASQGQVTPTQPPQVESKSSEGKTYKLEVVQEPVRARMCGFGDKDRRPITPPPCVRLIIIDDKTGQECDVNEFNTNFFILTVDLWDESGTKEVNLVRHSATSPSISAATSSSYPPPSQPVYPYSANTAATMNAHSQAAAATTGMQVHAGLTPPGYGPQGYNTHHAAPYMSQPPQHAPSPAQAAAAMPTYNPPDPSHASSRSQDVQSYYVSPTGQPMGAAVQAGASPYGAYGGMPGYPGGMAQMLSPAHAAPMDPRSAPSGMFTRNLIGSLAVNANPLTDTSGKMGIWFILQDLSVRTEGTFRLKMQFCCVADPGRNTLNRGNAPILSATFSAPFHVYSAKKFPGVIESTPLSKCFAMQGVKIPIRKDGPTGKAAEVDDNQDD